MNPVTVLITLRCLCAIVAVSGAAALAYFDKGGWGWFLFVAVLIAPSWRSDK